MKTSSRRLDQDEYARLSLTSSEDVFKTSSRCLGQDQYIRLGYTSSRRLQDVFKTSSRRLAKRSSRHLQGVFKTSSRRLQDVLKLKNVFKTSLRRIIKLNCSCEHVFEKDSTRFRDFLFQRRLSSEEYAQVILLLINLWSGYKIGKRDKNLSCQIVKKVLVLQFTTPLVATFRCVFRTWSNIYNGAFLQKYFKSLSC